MSHSDHVGLCLTMEGSLVLDFALQNIGGTVSKKRHPAVFQCRRSAPVLFSWTYLLRVTLLWKIFILTMKENDLNQP